MMRLGAVVLAGGKASRMGGMDKGLLRFGSRSCLELLLERLRGFSETYVSVDTVDRYPDCPVPKIVDAAPDQGPMQGIFNALEACSSDALLAVAVDMPLFDPGLAGYMAAFMHSGCRAVAALDRSGRRHPLCAIYAKSAAPVLAKRLAAGNRRLQDALDALDAVDAPLAHSIYPDSVLTNVNTPGDLNALAAFDPPPVFAVCGVKNSGKTTLLCRLIPLLRKKGLRVGVVKHDGHDFVPDVSGTDSFRLRKAGAERVAVYSSRRAMLIREGSGEDLAAFLPWFDRLDVVLVEGGKHSRLPKLEIVRDHQGGVPQSAPDGLLAVCTDVADRTDWDGNLPVFALDDYEGVCRFILEFLGRGTAGA